MTIRTEEEIRLFEDAIQRCEKTVWLVAPDGKEFDLKTPQGWYRGIACMLNAEEWMEPELFTTCVKDQMTLFEYFDTCRRAA